MALFGGRAKHGGARSAGADCPSPHRRLRPRELLRAARASGDYRAVVCSTGGRVALGSDLGGRAARACATHPVGVAVGAPAQRRARVQLPGAQAAVSLGRRGRHVRAARQRLRAGAGRAQRARRPPGGRQRLLARARHGARRRIRGGRARRASSSCSRSARPGKGTGSADGGLACQAFGRPSPRSSWSAWDPGPARSASIATSRRRPRREPERGGVARCLERISRAVGCARCMPTPTSWWCPRSGRVRSASRGVWSSTRR